MNRRDFLRRTSLSAGPVWAAGEFIQNAKALVDHDSLRRNREESAVAWLLLTIRLSPNGNDK